MGIWGGREGGLGVTAVGAPLLFIAIKVVLCTHGWGWWCWGCCCYGCWGCWGVLGGAVSGAVGVGVLLLGVLGVAGGGSAGWWRYRGWQCRYRAVLSPQQHGVTSQPPVPPSPPNPGPGGPTGTALTHLEMGPGPGAAHSLQDLGGAGPVREQAL